MESRIEDCLGFPYMERVHANASLKKWLSVCYCSTELHVISFTATSGCVLKLLLLFVVHKKFAHFLQHVCYYFVC